MLGVGGEKEEEAMSINCVPEFGDGRPAIPARLVSLFLVPCGRCSCLWALLCGWDGTNGHLSFVLPVSVPDLVGDIRPTVVTKQIKTQINHKSLSKLVETLLLCILSGPELAICWKMGEWNKSGEDIPASRHIP